MARILGRMVSVSASTAFHNFGGLPSCRRGCQTKGEKKEKKGKEKKAEGITRRKERDLRDLGDLGQLLKDGGVSVGQRGRLF